MNGELNMFSLIWHASFPVQAVMLILLGFSFASWVIIFRKRAMLNESLANADAFEERFWSGTDLAGYDSQLKTTRLFSSAADAVAFTQSADVQKTMKSVAKFSFEHGLLGEGASSEDFIGIGYPGGAVTGDKGNVKFRFDDTYMKMAAEQKL